MKRKRIKFQQTSTPRVFLASGSGSGQALLAVMTSLATEAPGLAEEQLLPLAAKAKLGTEGRRNLLLSSFLVVLCSYWKKREDGVPW